MNNTAATVRPMSPARVAARLDVLAANRAASAAVVALAAAEAAGDTLAAACRRLDVVITRGAADDARAAFNRTR